MASDTSIQDRGNGQGRPAAMKMKFDLFDMFLVAVSAVFGATTMLSPGGMVGAAIGSTAAILVAVIVKKITSN